MIQQFDAVYENGLLRPSHPLQLAEQERVHVLIIPPDDDDLLDSEFIGIGGPSRTASGAG